MANDWGSLNGGVGRPLFNRYPCQTLVGNWYEDRIRNEDCTRRFMQNKNLGNLSLQRKEHTREMLLAEAQLNYAVDNMIYFGDSIQLVYCPVEWRRGSKYETTPSLVVSVNVTNVSDYGSNKLHRNSPVTASSITNPAVRNVFTVVNEHGVCTERCPLRYGQGFCLRLSDGFTGGYCLRTHPASLAAPASDSLQTGDQVTVSDCVDDSSVWTFARPVCDVVRVAMDEGQPVNCACALMLYSRRTGRALRLLPGRPLGGPFGHTTELGVCARTATNSRNHVAPENILSVRQKPFDRLCCSTN